MRARGCFRLAAVLLGGRVGKNSKPPLVANPDTTEVIKMLSSVTNVPFSSQAQSILRNAARKKVFSNRFWITLPQSRRSAHAAVLSREKPTTIYLHVQKVIPLTCLSKATQKRILDENPPFFGSGVGILSDRRKWRTVTAERLIRLLNRTNEDRALFIDVNMTESLDVKYEAKFVIDIRPASSVSVFNAEQLDDPYKGEPQKGVALNAITGKRFSQPAHDILLGVGILRGYTSPMWVAERQLKYLNLELKKGALARAVPAPDMVGIIVSLSVVPPDCRTLLLRELKRNHPNAFGADIFYIYGVNGWEIMRSRVLVKNMAAVNDEKYPFHFVNLNDLALQIPKYANFVARFSRGKTPIGSALFEKKEPPSTKRAVTEVPLVVQRFRLWSYKAANPLFFFAEDATLRQYLNAECMTQPYLTVPSVRPIAILDGKLVGRRDETILRAFSLKHKLSSPLWLTKSGARKLGVFISPKYEKKYVTIGASAADEDPGEESVDGFYNIDDFSNPGEILALFPKASKKAHFMLDTKWRPVLGKQRQEFLSSLRRKVPLWVSVNECLMSGFEPISGTSINAFPTKLKGNDSDGTKLYNSQYTSDPVRVIGLSTAFVRPQGTTL